MFRMTRVLAVLSTVAIFGCSGDDDDGPAQETRELIDCVQICSAYDACKEGDDFDRSNCIDQCEDRSDRSAVAELQAEKCQVCVSEESCEGDTFKCTVQCAGIIPYD
jgi:hypothetical protein